LQACFGRFFRSQDRCRIVATTDRTQSCRCAVENPGNYLLPDGQIRSTGFCHDIAPYAPGTSLKNALRAKSNLLNELKLIWVVQIDTQKYFSFAVGPISASTPAVPCPHEGRFAIVTKRWAWDAMDAFSSRGE